MSIDTHELLELTVKGSLIGVAAGIVAAMFCVFNSPVLPESNFLFCAVVQAVLQFCLGGFFGMVLGGLTMAISVPKWKSEGSSVLQTFLAPTVFMILIAVGVFNAQGTLSLYFSEIVVRPLIAATTLWLALCCFVAFVALFASVGRRGFGD